MDNLTELASWNALKEHSLSMQLSTLNDLHEASESRQQQYTITSKHITLDYSNQRFNETTLERLFALANERDLSEKIHRLMQGDIVNLSEKKPALHTALRVMNDQPILVDGQNIIPDILQTRKKIHAICEKIRSGHWLGFSGKPITAIVNIGIGGSDLGPRFCMNALSEFVENSLSYHFISDVDPNAFSNAVTHLKPETTLFIISSKSFTTQETLYNTKKAIAWLGKNHPIDSHLIAVTAHKERAQKYGITHILPIWDWVGGRYSACSAVNLITAIAIGFEQFTQLLLGANDMDNHFRTASFENNLPVILALFGIWNINYLSTHNLLILTYSKYLEYFVPYIQQLDMESNGKSIDNRGRAVNHNTGPIVWGGLGNQAQHSYYQLLCQGTHKVTLDFITLKSHENELIHEMYMAKKWVLTHGIIDEKNPNQYIPGNIPLNHLSLTDCSPATIGALIALYEHKVYTQSVIWDINPFDQPGVESAKRVINQERAQQPIT
jgi:glucose-6-phosphate isomerase